MMKVLCFVKNRKDRYVSIYASARSLSPAKSPPARVGVRSSSRSSNVQLEARWNDAHFDLPVRL